MDYLDEHLEVLRQPLDTDSAILPRDIAVPYKKLTYAIQQLADNGDIRLDQIPHPEGSPIKVYYLTKQGLDAASYYRRSH